jgi:Right handed beta helix region
MNTNMTVKQTSYVLCLFSFLGLPSGGLAAAPAETLTLLDAVAYPGKLTGLRDSGPLVIGQSSTTIQGLRIRNPNGPCLLINPEVRDIVIRNNEIGPCLDDGVRILSGARNIRIDHNHIHDTTVILPESKYQSTIDGNGIQAEGAVGLIARMNYIQNVTSGLVAFGGSDIRFEYNYVLDVHGDHAWTYIPKFLFFRTAF